MSRLRVEDSLQMQVCEFLDRALPPTCIYYAINNNSVSASTGKRLKLMGVVAGTPDIAFVSNGVPFFIELKRPKTLLHRAGRLSDVQSKRHDHIVKAGAAVWTCDTLQDVQNVLEGMSIPLKARISA